MALTVWPAPCLQAAGTYSTPLKIPARLLWPNAGGYCGETSAQTAALLNGAWVSQGAWRAAGGGPTSIKGQLLLTVNLDSALTKMRLTWVRWDQTPTARGLRRSGAPEFAAFKVGWGLRGEPLWRAGGRCMQWHWQCYAWLAAKQR